MYLLTKGDLRRASRREDGVIRPLNPLAYIEHILCDKLHLCWRCSYCGRMHLRNKVAFDFCKGVVDPATDHGYYAPYYCWRGGEFIDALSDAILVRIRRSDNGCNSKNVSCDGCNQIDCDAHQTRIVSKPRPSFVGSDNMAFPSLL